MTILMLCLLFQLLPWYITYILMEEKINHMDMRTVSPLVKLSRTFEFKRFIEYHTMQRWYRYYMNVPRLTPNRTLATNPDFIRELSSAVTRYNIKYIIQTSNWLKRDLVSPNRLLSVNPNFIRELTNAVTKYHIRYLLRTNWVGSPSRRSETLQSFNEELLEAIDMRFYRSHRKWLFHKF